MIIQHPCVSIHLYIKDLHPIYYRYMNLCICSCKLFQDELIEKMKLTLGEFYPEGPAKSEDYCRLVSDRHYQYVCR